jgi:hypothetical protein
MVVKLKELYEKIKFNMCSTDYIIVKCSCKEIEFDMTYDLDHCKQWYNNKADIEKEKKRLKTISCGCEEHKVKIPTQFVGKTGNLMVKKDALEKIQEFKNKKICSKCYTFYIFKEEVIYE